MVSGKRVPKWAINSLVGLGLSLIVAIGVIKYTVGWVWTIPQDGMYPTLPAGSLLFGLKNPYRDVKEVSHGDIVVFSRLQGPDRYIYIWRVVGLPGESVEIDDGRVILDGKGLPQERVGSREGLDIFRETNGDVSYEVAYDRTPSGGMPRSLSLIVPEDHLFVMGDNRQHASDSRVMGPIPFDSVSARKW